MSAKVALVTGSGKRRVALGRVQRAQRGDVAGRGVGGVDLRYREPRHDLVRLQGMGGTGAGREKITAVEFFAIGTEGLSS